MLQTMTETDECAVNSRKRLKGVFLDKDKMQMSSYIKDLEKTLAINKEIIADLLDKSPSSLSKTTQKLNAENAGLHLLLKKTVRERDDCQARLLISEQIAEEFHGKEADLERQCADKVQECVDQLNMKEYVLQTYEKRYNRAIVLLRKYAEKDAEIRLLMREWNRENEPERRCITNLVEENEALVTEVQTARQQLVQLQTKFAQLTQTVDVTEEMSALSRPLTRKRSEQTEDTTSIALKEIVARMHVDREKVAARIEEVQRANEDLRRINAELSRKLAVLSAGRPHTVLGRRIRGFSTANAAMIMCQKHEIGIQRGMGMDGVVVERCDSFAASLDRVSSIHEESLCLAELAEAQQQD